MVEWQEVKGAWSLIAIGFLLMVISLLLVLLEVSMGIVVIPLVAGAVLVVGTSLYLRLWVLQVLTGCCKREEG